MDKLDIRHNGMPATNETWDFLQEVSRAPLIALGKLLGNFSIIDGLRDKLFLEVGEPEKYTAGWITVDGEMIPFLESEVDPKISIVSTETKVNYFIDPDDNAILTNDVLYLSKYAVCGTVPGADAVYNLTDFKRLQRIDNTISAVAKGRVYLGELVPVVSSLEQFEVPIVFDNTAGVNNYLVMAHFSLADGSSIAESDLDWAVQNKTASGFTLVLKATNGALTGVFFDYYAAYVPQTGITLTAG